jgi:SAM-dependent methyltransferase
MVPSRYAAKGHRFLEAMRGANRYANAVFAEIEAVAPPVGARILDFGAGDGVFFEKFDALGHSVDCVEPDPDFSAQLKAKANAVFSNIYDVPSDTYSFVYTVNVLEHIPNLDDHLKELHRVLKPGGVMFVFVPAFNILWTSLDDDVDHIQRFTRRTLSGFLSRSSFVCERLRYFDSVGFPAALTVRALEALGAFQYSPGTIAFYDRYALPVSLATDTVCFPFFGKNLIAVAKKSPT